jgi:hypothetical protein
MAWVLPCSLTGSLPHVALFGSSPGNGDPLTCVFPVGSYYASILMRLEEGVTWQVAQQVRSSSCGGQTRASVYTVGTTKCWLFAGGRGCGAGYAEKEVTHRISFKDPPGLVSFWQLPGATLEGRGSPASTTCFVHSLWGVRALSSQQRKAAPCVCIFLSFFWGLWSLWQPLDTLSPNRYQQRAQLVCCGSARHT